MARSFSWPLLRQIARGDLFGLGRSAYSPHTDELQPRTRQADRVARSVCPYCAVGCGQLVYVKDERVTDIEGDPDSFISEGTLCPKGAATFQLVTGPHRTKHVLYRAPRSRSWERIPLEQAMDMGRGAGQARPRRALAGPLHEPRAPRRRHARQRGELPRTP